jgi:tripeptide aminopeptidase
MLDTQVDHMIKEFERAAHERGATVVIDHRRHYTSYTIPPDAEVVRHAVAGSRSLGFSGELRTTLGGSDANVFNTKGVPSIVIATGMDKIHTHDENVSRRDLVDTTRLVVAILGDVAGV